MKRLITALPATLLLGAACLLTASCADEKKTSFLELFDEPQTVATEEVLPDVKRQLLAPGNLYAEGEYLVFVEPMTDTLLTAFRVTDGSCTRLLSRGQGPMEATGISSLGYGGAKGCVFAHDSNGSNTYKVYLPDASGESCSLSKDTFAVSPVCGYVAFDGDLRFYEQTGTAKRFLLATPAGQYLFGDSIYIEGVDAKSSSINMQGPCALSPVQKRLVWFSSMGDVFEIYDYADPARVRQVAGEVCFLPAMRDDGAVTLQAHIGVRSLAVDDEHIYALYIGKTLESLMKAGGASKAGICSQTILVFDWEGKPVRRLELDREMYAITYSAARRCLYGLGLDDEDNYAVYQIEVGD